VVKFYALVEGRGRGGGGRGRGESPPFALVVLDASFHVFVSFTASNICEFVCNVFFLTAQTL
jgi:hypothetical protein